ncbi:hypothetical protein [Neisseria sp. S1]|uniref:hypothetical protein n=1 Tax=Neisseria sp. S1 TaxID=3318354 RepID=UPI003A8A722D
MGIINRDHPQFNELMDTIIDDHSKDMTISNRSDFKDSIEYVELVDGQLKLKFRDGISMKKIADDESGETYVTTRKDS